MTLNTIADKSGWTVHAPHVSPDPHLIGTRYRMPFGKHRGRHLDEVPVEYLAWLSDHAESPSLRLLAKRLLDIDVVLDDADELVIHAPSRELAADVLPRLCFEFEQLVRAEFGEIDPGTLEAKTLARLLAILREIEVRYTGVRFPKLDPMEGRAA